jgi:hypothetical protein
VSFLSPQALLLWIPIGLWLWRGARLTGPAMWLRVALGGAAPPSRGPPPAARRPPKS